MDEHERARRSGDAMWAGDAASRAAGMRIEEIGPGCAVLSQVLRGDQLNGHGTAHGGVLFTLADSAFAFACNSRNRRAVAQHAAITFLSAGRGGERLLATAREAALMGRSGTYDVTVTGEDGRTVAIFQGLSRIIGGTHFDEERNGEAAP